LAVLGLFQLGGNRIETEFERGHGPGQRTGAEQVGHVHVLRRGGRALRSVAGRQLGAGGIVTLFMCLAESAPQQQSSSNAHPASGAGAVAAAAVVALALARVPRVPERLGGSSVPLYAGLGRLRYRGPQ
jgi:hypothetical protein